MEAGNPISELSPPTDRPSPLAKSSEPPSSALVIATPALHRGTAWRWLLLAAILLVALGAAGWKWPSIWQEWFGLAPAPTSLIVSGNIEAHQSVVGFKTVQSRIVELPFDEGKWVKAGTMLARVDDADYRQQVAITQAELEVQRRQLDATQQNLVATQKTVVSDQADLAMKKLDYARYQSLWGHGYATTEQRDQAVTALKQSQAALERDQALELAGERNIELAKANIHNADESVVMAQITLGYTTLVAPFDGVILVREAELGEIAQPGTSVVTLADLDHVWVRAYINETDISRVRLGAAVTVTTDTYPTKQYRGRISFISSSAEFTPKTVETHAERVTLVYRIKIDVDNPTHELVPGMPADAAIQLPAP